MHSLTSSGKKDLSLFTCCVEILTSVKGLEIGVGRGVGEFEVKESSESIEMVVERGDCECEAKEC